MFHVVIVLVFMKIGAILFLHIRNDILAVYMRTVDIRHFRFAAERIRLYRWPCNEGWRRMCGRLQQAYCHIRHDKWLEKSGLIQNKDG